MASYCLTVTRLRVRKRYFTFKEFLIALLSSTQVTTGGVCLVIRPPSLQADLQRVNVDYSARRAAVSQVTASQFDSWLRRIVTVIYHVRPDNSHYSIVILFRTVSISVNINWIVVENGPRFPVVCKVIARLRNFLNARLMTVDSWQVELMHSSVFLALCWVVDQITQYMLILNSTGAPVRKCLQKDVNTNNSAAHEITCSLHSFEFGQQFWCNCCSIVF